MSIKFNAEKRFDVTKKRFYLNNEPVVFHCHHYTTLLTQLANDTAKFDGPEIMFSAAEETFYPIFNKYFENDNIKSKENRVSIIEQYFSYVGLGLLKIDLIEQSAELFHSHLDEAWIKKWSNADKPVNYITQGFLSAAFSSINDISIKSFNVKEIQSIVCGAETSKFIIEKKQEK